MPNSNKKEINLMVKNKIRYLFLILAILSVCCLVGCSNVIATEEYKEGLIVIKDGEKYGYCDLEGNIIIPATYNAADSFYNGYANVRVYENGHSRGVIIDTSGNVVFDPFKDLPDGITVYDDTQMNGEGLIVIEKKVEGTYNEAKKTLYGVIDVHGNEVIALQDKWKPISEDDHRQFHYSNTKFSNGYAWVLSQDSKYAYLINKNNEIEVTEEIDSLPYESLIFGDVTDDGLTTIHGENYNEDHKVDNGFWLVKSVSGNTIMEVGFDECKTVNGSQLYISDGTILWENKYYNLDGSLMLDVSKEYDEVDCSTFNNGFAAISFVGKDGERYYAYIDKTGDFVYEPQNEYNDLGDFYGEYALIESVSPISESKTGYVIDSNFNIISKEIENPYKMISEYGHVITYQGELIDASGNKIEIK